MASSGAGGDGGTGWGAGLGAIDAATMYPPKTYPAGVTMPGLTLVVGDPIASGDVSVMGGGTVSGTTADGVTYTLTVPPGSVETDTQVSIRPVTGTSDWGAIAAGADLEPHGLFLDLPAMLTIDGASVPDATLPFWFGDPSAVGNAGEVVWDERSDSNTVRIPIIHFSGSVEAALPNGADSLWTIWGGAHNDASPEGRQAAAEARYAAAEYGVNSRRISYERGQEIQQEARSAWADAERDRIAQSQQMRDIADNPTAENLAALQAMLQQDLTRTRQQMLLGQDDGTSSPLELAILDTLSTYVQNLANNVLNGADMQARIAQGALGDLNAIAEISSRLIGNARALVFLGLDGGESTTQLAVDAVIRALKGIRDGLYAHCSTDYVSPALLAGFQQQLSLLGGEAGTVADMFNCHPKPTPGAELPRTITGEYWERGEFPGQARFSSRYKAVFTLVGDNPKAPATYVVTSGSLTYTREGIGGPAPSDACGDVGGECATQEPTPTPGPNDCPAKWTASADLTDPSVQAWITVEDDYTLSVEFGVPGTLAPKKIQDLCLFGDMIGIDGERRGDLVATGPMTWSFAATVDVGGGNLVMGGFFSGS